MVTIDGNSREPFLASLRRQAVSLFSLELEDENKSVGRADFRLWKFLLLIVFCCALLFLRRPDGLLNAQFFAEDGTVFFKDAFELAIGDAIIKPYAGYFHLVPRIIAAFCALFPVSTIPTIYSAISLLITGICVSWFYLPHFRFIVRNDLLRLLFVLALVLGPNHDALMKLTYIQWYALLWATLVTLMRPPKNYWIWCLIILGLIVTFWTSPTTLILLPIWLLKLIYSKIRKEKYIAGFIIVIGILCFVSIIVIPPSGQATIDERLSLGDLPRIIDSIKPLINSLCTKVISPSLFGDEWTYRITHFDWLLLYLISFVLLLGFLLMFIKNRSRIVINILLLYLIGASLLTFAIWRPYVLIDILYPNLLSGDRNYFLSGGRYFFLGTSMVLLYIIVYVDSLVDSLSLRDSISYVKKGSLILGFIAIISLNLFTFKQGPFVNMEWPKYSELIVSAQQSLRINESKILEIPINPPGWLIELEVWGKLH